MYLISSKITYCFLKTVGIVCLSTITSLVMNTLGIGKESIIMVFLLGVLFTSVLTNSYVWGVLTSFASLMLFNFLFTDPRFTFVIYSRNDIVLLAFFLITAVVSGTVTSKLQQQIAISEKNEDTTHTLYRIAAGFLPVSGTRSIALRAVSFINEYLGCDCAIQLDGSQSFFTNSAELPKGPSQEYIIQSNVGRIGRMLIFEADTLLDKHNALIVQAVVTQLGIALDREQLYSKQETIRLAMEKEQLRANLLRSVAHDLRSPLTALSGASNLLAENYEDLSDSERKKLALDITDEIHRLTNLVENILNMTRINDSQLVINKTDEVIDDVVNEGISHTSRLFKERSLTVHLPDEVIVVPMDGKLIVQVMINLLENAARHTPLESLIDLTVRLCDKEVVISVSDTGEGVDPLIEDNLFDRFVTLDHGITDSRRGMGLGLAICKAIVEAHGGTIQYEPNLPKGSRFTFALPLEG